MLSRGPRLAILTALSLQLLLLVWTQPSESTVVLRFDLRELTRKATAIVVAICEQTESRWDETGKLIFTYSSFRVLDSLKGEMGEYVTVRELGGEAGGLTMAAAGVPRYERGEQAVLFLWKGPSGHFQTLGLWQGKFPLYEEIDEGFWMVRKPGPLEARERAEVPLDEFLDEIRAYLRE